MAHVIYNGQILPEAELHLSLQNRAFQYSDGFFETIIVENGKVRFWSDHLDRIKEACTLLRIALPPEFNPSNFVEQILALVQQNKCGSSSRVKLKFWRAGEGLYTPQTNTANCLLTAQPAAPFTEKYLHVGVCNSITTSYTPFSSFKGIHAPVYVLASLEKQQRALDDVILLDTKGNVAEATSSNLFWVKGQTLFTPALETGCLNGIMRRNLIRWANKNNWQVKEDFYSLQEVLDSELVFLGNVTGLQAIHSIEGQTLPLDKPVLEKLREVLN